MIFDTISVASGWNLMKISNSIAAVENSKCRDFKFADSEILESQLQDSRFSESQSLGSLRFKFSKPDVEIKKFIKFGPETLKIKSKIIVFFMKFDRFSIIFNIWFYILLVL